ncbi:P-type phospholipid transporter [Mycena sanguinolenta]|uniref:P-type phospholipid transporter n=1 Tax=Mycena sanguinolenta TaxID=230812 RepID=A0A8H6ZDW3_9AGAR|nr:P-type phospholipid transporter [Mycena sanguinolenta]
MSLREELEIWVAALEAYDQNEFEKALDLFSGIADQARILTNMGLIYATLGDHEAAVERFFEATTLDSYLAIAYFQSGVSNFLLERYDLAYKNFEETLLYLRGNQAINYEQLGLNFKLFLAEALFNQGLCLIRMGRIKEGLADMEEARRAKANDEHNVIDDAIAYRGESYTVFSIPAGILYRPSGTKVKNLKPLDYLGKAILVAGSDANDTTVGFSGIDRLQRGLTPTGAFIDAETRLARSNTGAPRNKEDGAAPPSRSKTTLNAVSKPVGGDSDSAPTKSLSTGPTRSNTILNTSRALPTTQVGGPERNISMRRAGSPPSGNKPLPGTRGPVPPPPVEAKERGEDPSRLTAIYDDYLDPYDDEPTPDRVAPSASSNANVTRNPPTSNYAQNSYGTRRRVTRRNTARRNQKAYEDEEGYASGDDLDELSIIRVRVHHNDDVRGMTLSPETLFEEFIDIMTTRFGKKLTLKFTDEDGFKVSLKDQLDYDLALETARENSKGKPEGKLEIWCLDA